MDNAGIQQKSACMVGGMLTSLCMNMLVHWTHLRNLLFAFPCCFSLQTFHSEGSFVLYLIEKIGFLKLAYVDSVK